MLNVSGHGDRATCAWKQESGWFGAAYVAVAVASAAAVDFEREGVSLGNGERVRLLIKKAYDQEGRLVRQLDVQVTL